MTDSTFRRVLAVLPLGVDGDTVRSDGELQAAVVVGTHGEKVGHRPQPLDDGA